MDSLGFAMWPQRHDPELISRIWAGYQDTIDDDRACLDMGSRIPEAVRYICNPLERIPEIRGLLDEKARSVLDHHYGGHWRVESVRVWRTGYLPPAERRYHHYGNLWHCDQHPISRQKLFVQIQGDESLARTEDSAFRFHDVKSTRQLMRAGYVGPGQIYGPARRMIEDPNHIIKFDRPSGSAIFCNTTRCVHRAGVPAEGTTRGMVQFMFVASDTLRPGLLDDGDVLDIGPDTGVVPGRFA
jgi:hypothetical protein